MKTLSDLLADVIPTKWSRAIAVLTLGLIPLAYNAPSLLPPAWLPNSPEQIFLIRLLLSGTFITLVLVVRAYNALVKSHATEIEAINAKHKTKINLEDSPRFNKKINYPP